MNRFFAFGCSFTYWNWWTWADILGHSYGSNFQNWGKPGGGNGFIFNSVMEADERNTFTKDDLVIVQWTNITREDRYVNDGWLSPGNIYSQKFYSDEFVEEFADNKGYLIRDCAYVKAVYHFLKSTGCEFHFIGMTPFHAYDQYRDLEMDELEYYKSYLVMPTFKEIVFGGKWTTKNRYRVLAPEGSNIDLHPTVQEHLQFVDSMDIICPESARMIAIEEHRRHQHSVIDMDNEERNRCRFHIERY